MGNALNVKKKQYLYHIIDTTLNDPILFKTTMKRNFCLLECLILRDKTVLIHSHDQLAHIADISQSLTRSRWKQIM